MQRVLNLPSSSLLAGSLRHLSCSHVRRVLLKMPSKDKYTDPKLRDEVKEEIQQSDKGGEPGQWSARKAQMMAKEYKKRGGDYNTDKSEKDESQKNLSNWGEEDWQTKEGSGEAKKGDGSRKRYLPKKAWEQMSEREKQETDSKKQQGSKEGKQHVDNTSKAKDARKNVSKNSKSDDEDDTTKHNDEIKEDSASSGNEEEQASEKENDSPPPSSPNRKRTRGQTQDDKKEKPTNTKKQKGNDGSPTKKKTTTNNDNSNNAAGGKSNSKQSKQSNTVGSKHDNAEAPAQQASVDRLPKKGQHAHWKALPGWVDGEVVEIVQTTKKVDGKQVKGSKDDPKIVLKSSKSGKICVHNVNNVYFD